MNYGALITDSFRLIWREKRLWLLGLIGLLLYIFISALSLTMSIGWPNFWVTQIQEWRPGPGLPPAELLRQLWGAMGGLLWLFVLFMILALAHYGVSLVVRAAIISEAQQAWQGQPVVIGRGLQNGLRHALGLFLIDLLWVLPMLLVNLFFVIIAFGAFFAIFNAAITDNGGNAGPALGGLGVTLVLAGCCLPIFALAWLTMYSIYSPMMYQSLVQQGLPPGAAIRTGWQMGRAHWKPLLVVALLLFLVGALVVAIQQTIAIPVQFSTMPFWMPDFKPWLPDSNQSVYYEYRPAFYQNLPADFTFSKWLWLIFGWGATTAVYLITMSFSQSFGLTLYARVYQELTAPAMPVAAPAEYCNPPADEATWIRHLPRTSCQQI